MSDRALMIDPSGRPLKNAGFEAVFALGLVFVWMVIIAFVFYLMRRSGDMGAAQGWPFFSLAGLCCLCWAFAEHIVGRRYLVWPGSALGVLGPMSLGFAIALSTPELRTGPFQLRLAITATVAGVAMIPFLFRFKLPGLVSPIITFSLVGLFLGLYGADMERMREVEGFSPRGIIAALMTQPLFGALFGALALGATWLARTLDRRGNNFELAAARPLHLIGAGVVALVIGRILAMLPAPGDIAALSLLWVAAIVWTLRVNRVAVMFATHFAMAKPLIKAVAAAMGAGLDLWDWTVILGLILIVDLAIWPPLHRLSRRLDWTRGPGWRRPPLDREGWFWRYWPYALEERTRPAESGVGA